MAASYTDTAKTYVGQQTVEQVQSGTFANVADPGNPISWYGLITTAYGGTWTGYSGQTGAELPLLGTGSGTPTDSRLIAAGFPATTSLAFQGSGSAQSSTTTTIDYHFSTTVPVGTTFYLWDPGQSYSNAAITSSFLVQSSLNGSQQGPSTLALTAINAFAGNPLTGTYSTAGNNVVVNNYNGTQKPEEVVQIVTTKPIDDLTVVASTTVGDVWGLAIEAPGAVTTDTVIGASGSILSIPVADLVTNGVMQLALAGISTGITQGTLSAYVSGSAPTVSGATSQQIDGGGLAAMAASDVGFVDDSALGVTLFGGSAANQTIVSALGGLFVVAGAGSGTVVGGGGNNTFLALSSTTGAYSVVYAKGNNTVVTAYGADTISAGSGANLVFLGAGSETVASTGTDTIVGGSGSATVSGSSTGSLVFGSNGIMNFVGGAGVATVVGLNAVLQANGGAGGGLFFGGTAGNNAIVGGAGSATIFGGGSGDYLAAGGAGLDVLAGGVGNETLTGANSSGTNTYFLGYGADLAYGGSGTSSFVIGPGSDTIVGGSGLNSFVFQNGRGGGTDYIQGFNPNTSFISLQGFGATADADAFNSQKVVNGSANVSLADGTKIIFVGVANIGAGSFV